MDTNLIFQAGVVSGALFGFLFGTIFALFIVAYISYTQKISVARYIQRLSNDTKDKVKTEIKALRKQTLIVAEMTNTNFFNSMYNELSSLSQRIKRKWIP